MTKTREIKFRAWGTRSHKMYCDDFIITCDGVFHWLEYICGDKRLPESDEIEELLKKKHDIDAPAVIDFADWSFEDIVLLQYTGLKDKNGKEIYEGDIFLHAADAQDEDGDPRPFHGVVIWLEDLGAWGWYPPEATVAMSTLMPESGDIEIVGNIYENPELLAGDKHGKE